MKVFQAPNVSIEYFASSMQIHQTWNDFVSSDIFREAIDQTVLFARKHPVRSIVSDALKQRAVSPDDSAYASSVMPELYKAGIEVMAFVIPENIFTKMALRKFAGVENAAIHLQFFSSVKDAVEWIESVVVS
ncbi:MAG: hypothetical protein JXR39_05265 [Marinilabiliaceae bacterium]|nr:hypothetical protein [Marinilabiliaceae bacterium]